MAEDRDHQDPSEEGEASLDESRRRAGEEGRTIEDQPGSLTTDEDDGEVRAF